MILLLSILAYIQERISVCVHYNSEVMPIMQCFSYDSKSVPTQIRRERYNSIPDFDCEASGT